MSVGIFTLIAVKEKSHSAFKMLLPFVIVSIIICFFGLLTSMAVLQRYTKDPFLSNKDNRNKEQGIQFALAGLLIGIFGLCFLFLSCLSCIICSTIPTFCDKHQSLNPQPFYSASQRHLSQEFPLQTQRRSIRNHLRRYQHPPSYAINRAYQT
jgi:hypothetical protein